MRVTFKLSSSSLAHRGQAVHKHRWPIYRRERQNETWELKVVGAQKYRTKAS